MKGFASPVRRACALLFGALAVGGAGLASGQSVATDPVGAIVIPLKGNSDTLVSLPFHRPATVETQAQSVSGNVITIPSSANVTGNQFVYNGTAQPNTYYVQFLTGNREGMIYTVVSNTATTLTVDNNGDTGLAGNVAANDSFQVIPYWTLNTAFPAGQGINQSAGPAASQRRTEIIFPDNVSAGIDKSAAFTYYYYNGSASGGPGWRKVGGTFSVLFNDTVIYPDTFFVARNNVAGDTQLTLVGAVPMSPYATPVSTLAANVSQDIFIGISVPANVTLGNSSLVQSGAFAASAGPTTAQRADQLFVFDYTTPTKNRSASEIYYYVSSGTPGWRKIGAPFSTLFDSAAIFQPGRGYVIRKKATPSPQTIIWTFTPNYLSN